ncbi:MAG: hypothetical protein NTX82_01550 [Candidatus Parcubacteria bacterium]|nr:hypothetical protein [Candidatus Parcubacteria bacterium]
MSDDDRYLVKIAILSAILVAIFIKITGLNNDWFVYLFIASFFFCAWYNRDVKLVFAVIGEVLKYLFRKH